MSFLWVQARQVQVHGVGVAAAAGQPLPAASQQQQQQPSQGGVHPQYQQQQWPEQQQQQGQQQQQQQGQQHAKGHRDGPMQFQQQQEQWLSHGPQQQQQQQGEGLPLPLLHAFLQGVMSNLLGPGFLATFTPQEYSQLLWSLAVILAETKEEEGGLLWEAVQQQQQQQKEGQQRQQLGVEVGDYGVSQQQPVQPGGTGVRQQRQQRKGQLQEQGPQWQQQWQGQGSQQQQQQQSQGQGPEQQQQQQRQLLVSTSSLWQLIGTLAPLAAQQVVRFTPQGVAITTWALSRLLTLPHMAAAAVEANRVRPGGGGGYAAAAAGAAVVGDVGKAAAMGLRGEAAAGGGGSDGVVARGGRVGTTGAYGAAAAGLAAVGDGNRAAAMAKWGAVAAGAVGRAGSDWVLGERVGTSGRTGVAGAVSGGPAAAVPMVEAGAPAYAGGDGGAGGGSGESAEQRFEFLQSVRRAHADLQELLSKLSWQASQQLEYYRPQEVANLLGGLARLQLQQRPLLAATAEYLKCNSHRLGARDVSDVICAFVGLKVGVEGKVGELLLGRGVELVNKGEMPGYQLAAVAWGLQRLGVQPKGLLEAAAQISGGGAAAAGGWGGRSRGVWEGCGGREVALLLWVVSQLEGNAGSQAISAAAGGGGGGKGGGLQAARSGQGEGEGGLGLFVQQLQLLMLEQVGSWEVHSLAVGLRALAHCMKHGSSVVTTSISSSSGSSSAVRQSSSSGSFQRSNGSSSSERDGGGLLVVAIAAKAGARLDQLAPHMSAVEGAVAAEALALLQQRLQQQQQQQEQHRSRRDANLSAAAAVSALVSIGSTCTSCSPSSISRTASVLAATLQKLYQQQRLHLQSPKVAVALLWTVAKQRFPIAEVHLLLLLKGLQQQGVGGLSPGQVHKLLRALPVIAAGVGNPEGHASVRAGAGAGGCAVGRGERETATAGAAAAGVEVINGSAASASAAAAAGSGARILTRSAVLPVSAAIDEVLHVLQQQLASLLQQELALEGRAHDHWSSSNSWSSGRGLPSGPVRLPPSATAALAVAVAKLHLQPSVDVAEALYQLWLQQLSEGAGASGRGSSSSSSRGMGSSSSSSRGMGSSSSSSRGRGSSSSSSSNSDGKASRAGCSAADCVRMLYALAKMGIRVPRDIVAHCCSIISGQEAAAAAVAQEKVVSSRKGGKRKASHSSTSKARKKPTEESVGLAASSIAAAGGMVGGASAAAAGATLNPGLAIMALHAFVMLRCRPPQPVLQLLGGVLGGAATAGVYPLNSLVGVLQGLAMLGAELGREQQGLVEEAVGVHVLGVEGFRALVSYVEKLHHRQRQAVNQRQKQKLRLPRVIGSADGMLRSNAAEHIPADSALRLIWSLLVLQSLDWQQQQQGGQKSEAVREALLLALLPSLTLLEVPRLLSSQGLLQQLLEVRLLLEAQYSGGHWANRGFTWVWRALCSAKPTPVPRRVTNECLVTSGVVRREWVRCVEQGWGVLMPQLQAVGRDEGVGVSGLWWLPNGEMYCLLQQQQQEEEEENEVGVVVMGKQAGEQLGVQKRQQRNESQLEAWGQKQQQEQQEEEGGEAEGVALHGRRRVRKESSSSGVVAVVLNGPQHVDGYSRQLLGAAWVRDAILASKGYTVVALPVALWLGNKSQLQQQQQERDVQGNKASKKVGVGWNAMQSLALRKAFAAVAAAAARP